MSHSPTVEYRGSNDIITGKRRLLVWVLKCDVPGCLSEAWNDGTDPAYATYVPSAWTDHGDGTHSCSDCAELLVTGHVVACREYCRKMCEAFVSVRDANAAAGINDPE